MRGTKGGSTSEQPIRKPTPDVLRDEQFLPLRTRVFRLAALVTALWLLDRFVWPAVNPYLARIAVLVGINVILAVSLNLINGFTGQFSLGHAGFMAVGGYLSAWLSLNVGPILLGLGAGNAPPPGGVGAILVLLLGLIIGSAGAAGAGLLIGIPTLRLRGDYLAIATLGFGEIIRVVILNVDAVGGARGYPDIPPYANFFWVYLFVIAALAFHWNLVHSRHGRALLSVREDEIAAESLGIPTTRYKVIAFTIGAAFAGLAGGLFAHYNSYLHTNSFTFVKSIEVVIMVVLGGMGSITGSVIAALLLTVMPELLRPIKEYRMVIYSLLLVVLMIARPQGIFGIHELDPRDLWRRLTRRLARGNTKPA